ncbi:hypothetical protein LXL04_037097 [Taraxacum kok-saghyz]
MKIPCCTVCQTRYNEEDRCPLLLECGHGFCKECLSRMFSSASSDTTLSSPRCRQVSVVGNSSASNSDFTDEDEDDEDDGLVVVVVDRNRRSCGSNASSSNGLIELGSHQDLRMVRRSCDG